MGNYFSFNKSSPVESTTLESEVSLPPSTSQIKIYWTYPFLQETFLLYHSNLKILDILKYAEEHMKCMGSFDLYVNDQELKFDSDAQSLESLNIHAGDSVRVRSAYRMRIFVKIRIDACQEEADQHAYNTIEL